MTESRYRELCDHRGTSGRPTHGHKSTAHGCASASNEGQRTARCTTLRHMYVHQVAVSNHSPPRVTQSCCQIIVEQHTPHDATSIHPGVCPNLRTHAEEISKSSALTNSPSPPETRAPWSVHSGGGPHAPAPSPPKHIRCKSTRAPQPPAPHTHVCQKQPHAPDTSGGL